MDLGKPIAYGRTAEIYAWEKGQILKLFYDWFPATAVEYEALVAHAVYASGLPVPKPGEVLTVQGRLGLEYERLDGLTMLGTFKKQPGQLSKLARQFAELHVHMHATPTGQPNSQHERLQQKIKEAKALSDPLKQAALQALESLPGGDRLCHGDFHPDNIIMAANGPIIIDWIDVTSGNPLADFARTAVLVRYGAPPPMNPLGLLLRWGRNRFYNVYFRRYFELSKEDPKQVQAWLPVIAAARLNENIASEESTLLSIVQRAYPLAGANP
jgi:uncharacterized protein (TIGR02172 family)